MARYVDIECDAVTEAIGRKAFRNRSDIQDFLNNIPTADVVPVVKCKECVFWDTESIGFSDEHICKMHSIVAVHSRYTNPTDYCSYGERRCFDENRTY